MSSPEKFDIQVDENTRNQVTLLHDNIPGYDLPTIDFVNMTTDQDEDISILEDNSQIYAYLDNVLVHMIDKQQTAIFKSNQDFNKNKEKISQYIKYTENWQVASVICSYMAMGMRCFTYCSNDCFSVEISENYASNACSIFTD